MHLALKFGSVLTFKMTMLTVVRWDLEEFHVKVNPNCAVESISTTNDAAENAVVKGLYKLKATSKC